MKKKILFVLLSLAVTICVSLVFAACGQSTRYSELEMEDGIVYLTDYSVKYTSEAESPLGKINESSLSEEKSDSVQTYYLVMDFDIQTAEDIPGMEWFTVTMKVLDADVVKATINYTNTSSTQEITSNGETTITATYSLPEKAKVIKNVNLVVELKSQNVGATDIICTFESDNKPVTGYEDSDTTYVYSSDNITLKKTSFKYTLNNGGQSYSVSGVGTKSGAMHMPDTYNGLPVTAITDSAFKNCTSMTKIIIPDSITSIGSAAFSGCSSLESITLPFVGATADASRASESTLFGYIFGTTKYTGGKYTKQCYSFNDSIGYYLPSILTMVTITDVNIFYGAFSNCSSLLAVTIGNNVTSIGGAAFLGCYKLLEVYNLSSLTITAGSSDYGYIAYYAKNVYTATSDKSKLIYNGDYVFFDDNENYYLMAYTGTETKLTLPELTVDGKKVSYGIYEYAFYDNATIKSVTIPDCVTIIGDQAFSYCTSLTSITISDCVTSIGYGAFSGCSSLVSITLPFVGSSADATTASKSTLFGYIFGNSPYTGSTTTKQHYAIDSYATYYIPTTLTMVTITGGNIFYGAFYNCNLLTNITIPDSVTTIGRYAFHNCTSLTSVTMGSGVTTIYNSAFDDCKSLASVYYNGTANKWNNISIDSYNDYLTSATIYYYAERGSTTVAGNYWYYDSDGNIKTWSVE